MARVIRGGFDFRVIERITSLEPRSQTYFPETLAGQNSGINWPHPSKIANPLAYGAGSKGRSSRRHTGHTRNRSFGGGRLSCRFAPSRGLYRGRYLLRYLGICYHADAPTRVGTQRGPASLPVLLPPVQASYASSVAIGDMCGACELAAVVPPRIRGASFGLHRDRFDPDVSQLSNFKDDGRLFFSRGGWKSSAQHVVTIRRGAVLRSFPGGAPNYALDCCVKEAPTAAHYCFSAPGCSLDSPYGERTSSIYFR